MNITKFTKDSTDYPINDARLPASLGSASQVLKMNSGASEIVWGDQDPGVIVSPTEPSGATENALWVDTSMSMAVLKRKKADSTWEIIKGRDSRLPVAIGTNGQVLGTDGSDILWSDLPDSLSDFTDDLGSNPTHTHSSKEDKGYLTLNGTQYPIAVSTTDQGTEGYITFVIPS